MKRKIVADFQICISANLMSDSHHSNKVVIFAPMKDECFLFYLKSSYLHFRPNFIVYVGKRFDKKAKESFKIDDVTSSNIANISKSKDNQTIKFSQLVEYNMRHIFLQISCRK